MRLFFRRTIFFLGWLLSPFTVWNDPLVNIPISYILANLYARFLPGNFPLVVLIFYWLSNVFGLYLMYLGGKAIIRDAQHALRELLKLVITVVVYSVILVLLGKAGFLKPL